MRRDAAIGPGALALTATRVAAPTSGGWADRRLKTKVFVVSVVVNLVAALGLAYVWEIGHGDGLARTANAWYVLYSRDPHLAAIGFVWPVLPSLVQLPLLPLVRAIGHPEVAGFVMSAASGAGVLVVLSAILGAFGVTGWTRLIWLALVQFHPQFWHLSAVGVAEMPYIFFVSLAVLALVHTAKTELALAVVGMSLAAALFVRYESLAFAGGFALVLLLLVQRRVHHGREETGGQLILQPRPLGRMLVQWWPRREGWQQLEGQLLMVLAPPAYAMVFWLLMNWLIMGDPLYFQRSEFSLAAAPDVARNVGTNHALYTTMGSLPLTAAYALKRLLQANVALPVLTVFALLLALRRGDRLLLGIVALVVVAAAFTASQAFLGTLPPYLRYWAYATPFALILAAGCARALRESHGRWVPLFCHAVSGLLLLGAVINGVSQSDESLAVDERRLSARLRGDIDLAQRLAPVDFSWEIRRNAVLLAPVLERLSESGLTLLASDTGYAVVLQAEHPERLAIAADRDYYELLGHPEQKLRYIAVADLDPTASGRDIINSFYPDFYERGAPWARLLGEVEGTTRPAADSTRPWRLYEVVAGPMAADGDDALLMAELRALGLRPTPDSMASDQQGAVAAAATLGPSESVVAIEATDAPSMSAPSTNDRPSRDGGSAAVPIAPLGLISVAPSGSPDSIPASGRPVAEQPAERAGLAPGDAGQAGQDIASVVPTAQPVLADVSAVQEGDSAATATTTPLEPLETYAVRPGDTLTSIAAAHGTTVDILAGMNAVSDPNRIREGAVLRVPRSAPADWELVLIRSDDGLRVVYVPRRSEGGR